MATGRELVFPGASPIFGGARVLPSPSQFFLTGEDRLRVVSVNALPGVTVQVQWRTAIPTGEIVPSSQTHTPTSDRTVKTQDYELGTGSLLNVTVFAASGSPMSGQTYLVVQIVRGFGAAAIVLGTLLAGYVTTVQALGFPGSPIVSSTEGEPAVRGIVGATPAAGAELLETVPTGARWELRLFYTTLSTSAAVGARSPTLSIDDGANEYYRATTNTTEAAGSFLRYHWAQGMQQGQGLVANLVREALPTGMLLLAGWRIGTSFSSLQAGDQFSAPHYLVREWLEVS